MYEVSGTPLLLQPETGGWQDRRKIGSDGQNRPVYEPTYRYQLRWGPMTVEQYRQLCAFFAAVSVTGTASMVLPCHCTDICAPIFTGTIYTNVLFEEPHMGAYWQEHVMDASLMVINIRI